MTTHGFAVISLVCGVVGWALFLSLFWDRFRLGLEALIERYFPARAHWVLLLWLLLDVLFALGALIFGHKSYRQSIDSSLMSDALLLCAGLVLGYVFWSWFGRYDPTNRWVVLALLLLLLLLGSICAMVLGSMSSSTFLALIGLLLGYIHLPILALGILFAIVPWHNSYRS